MEKSQVDQLLAIYGGRFSIGCINIVRENLLKMEYNQGALFLAQTKDPTIAIILSVLTGGLGIDRFYIGDTIMGVLKLITCGGCGIWTIIDLFLIMDATKEKNLQNLMMLSNA